MISEKPLLEMQGIDKSFPGVKALDKVDLTVYPGEVVALIGENGAGKSTLMNVLGGVVEPDSGTIKIEGQSVVIKNVSDAIKLGIGFIHQELNILDNLSIAGNIFLGREPTRLGPLRIINRRRMWAQTAPYLQELGLNLPASTLLSQMSIAHQQMVEVAKSLSLNARLLIMDEPTSSLTLSETKRLFDVIRQLRSNGVSIIYISHRLAEVKECADRVVGLRDGVNVGSLELEKITHDNMVRLMIGRKVEEFFVSPRAKGGDKFFSVSGLSTSRYPHHKISFEASRGEILGFAGLVGAGRTEMAHAIFGVEATKGGLVSISGEKLQIRCAGDAIENGIYLVPEDRRKCGLITEMTFRENITLPDLNRYAVLGLIKRSRETVISEKQCEKLKIKLTSVETLVKNLSGGNQQKVVLAKWLSLKPKVIIFDEPTRGIDIGSKAEIYHLMRNLADEGVVIVMISSDMEEILGVSDRVAVMHEGKITGILTQGNFDEEAVMRLAVGQKDWTGNKNN
ncbi:MAG: sugar ABC transporter ATP-binding protein [Sedimentisphaerales bacterium]|nr:sugar ABC transporter ATP-binding protein [Sedimentisphaerales bacterium]